MTQRDRDVSARRVYLDVVQAVVSRLDPAVNELGSPVCADIHIYVIQSHACDYAAGRWDTEVTGR